MDYFQAVNKEKDCREEKKKGITLKEAKKMSLLADFSFLLLKYSRNFQGDPLCICF